MQKPYFIVIAGPTAVGKTDFSCDLALEIDGEVINADVGQFYTPLAIGTAKPDWRAMPVQHHLFDVLSTPGSYNIMQYRQDVSKLMQEIWSRGKTPIIVGGSSFYIKALYFLLQESMSPQAPTNQIPVTWENLHAIDPKRALQISKNDRYRIERALTIWSASGIKPSEIQEDFNPLAQSYFINIQRPRADLYERINLRTEIMLKEGWIEEVQGLMDTEWIPFLQQKKIIGYPEIIDFLENKISYETLVATIQKKTRNYAKRQCTFLRMLEQKLLAQR